MAVETIPIIDFSDFKSDPKKVAQQVYDACTTIGFFYMINHGIPEQDIKKAFAISKQFFNLSVEDKEEFNIGRSDHGYHGLYTERLDPENQNKGDHKEGFDLRAFQDGEPFASLPPVLHKEKLFLDVFSQRCHQASLDILEMFAIALEIPEDEGGKEFFKNGHGYKGTTEYLRFLKYPRGGEAEYKKPVRAGAHSDYGSITLLFQGDIPGLEVQASRTEWISAPIIPGAITVNIADQMEMWTNGLFKSSKHRVVFLPEHNHFDRYSMPYFVQANPSVPLKPAPSKFVDQAIADPDNVLTAGEHVLRRFDLTYDLSHKKYNNYVLNYLR